MRFLSPFPSLPREMEWRCVSSFIVFFGCGFVFFGCAGLCFFADSGQVHGWGLS